MSSLLVGLWCQQHSLKWVAKTFPYLVRQRCVISKQCVTARNNIQILSVTTKLPVKNDWKSIVVHFIEKHNKVAYKNQNYCLYLLNYEICEALTCKHLFAALLEVHVHSRP